MSRRLRTRSLFVFAQKVNTIDLDSTGLTSGPPSSSFPACAPQFVAAISSIIISRYDHCFLCPASSSKLALRFITISLRMRSFTSTHHLTRRLRSVAPAAASALTATAISKSYITTSTSATNSVAFGVSWVIAAAGPSLGSFFARGFRTSSSSSSSSASSSFFTGIPHPSVAAGSSPSSSSSSYVRPFSSTAETPAASTSEKKAPTHTVLIVGSGPAAHTAAIYCARARLEPVLYEGFMAGGVAPGGQLTTTTEVENYPGFPKGISGPDLMDLFRQQSVHHGTKIHTETISHVDLSQRPFKVWVEGSNPLTSPPDMYASTLIIATGATARRLNIPGEEKYWNAGISACAVCDGAAPLFRNKALAVVGGGDSAAEEAQYLTKYAEKVYLLVRRDKMRASKVMQDRVLKHPKIQVLWNTVPVEALGAAEKSEAKNAKFGDVLERLKIKSTKTGEVSELPVNGLFYAVGHDPNTSFLAKINRDGGAATGSNDLRASRKDSQVELDEDGYIKVVPGSTYTNVEGVFAAGDVQDKKYRQAITAAGSGAAAALDCERWLEAQGGTH
ncbi:thioredoxin-disulfide reductase [Chytridiales sp. JEL 0842]|nr:thioredoxin-disulfide reductase [Chytridiales sp. JEL 0842]